MTDGLTGLTERRTDGTMERTPLNGPVIKKINYGFPTLIQKPSLCQIEKIGELLKFVKGTVKRDFFLVKNWAIDLDKRANFLAFS